MSANLGMNNLYLDSDPVTKISGRRIKSLLAQTNTQKLMLDNHIKDLIKQAARHRSTRIKVKIVIF